MMGLTTRTWRKQSFLFDLNHSVFNDHLASGTLHAPEKFDLYHAKLIKNAFMRNPSFERPASATEEEWIVSITERNDYKLETMKLAVGDLKRCVRIQVSIS
jgi:hypothetical protein